MSKRLHLQTDQDAPDERDESSWLEAWLNRPGAWDRLDALAQEGIDSGESSLSLNELEAQSLEVIAHPRGSAG